MSVYALGSVAASGLNELRVDKLISKDSANTFFEYDSANTKFEMNLDQITNNHLPVYACRAWVNFNGTLDEGGGSLSTGENVLIRESGNISSVTYNGTGNYTVNFTTEMPDINYAVSGFAADGTATAIRDVNGKGTSFTTSSIQVFLVTNNNTSFSADFVNLSVFR